MTITNSFRAAVSNGDVLAIRIMMKDSLLVDLSFEEFHEMSRLASQVKGLYDLHDGRGFINDKTVWDDNYMNKLMVEVVGNFSHERIDHLKDVVRYLRPWTAQAQPSSLGSRSYSGRGSDSGSQSHTRSEYQRRNRRLAKIAGGALGGAAVGGAIAAVASRAVIVCGIIGIGAVVGGLAVHALTKEKRQP